MAKFTCGLCGELHGSIGDNAPSTIVVTASHENTEHNGARLILKVCDSCVSWFLDSLQGGAGIGGNNIELQADT